MTPHVARKKKYSAIDGRTTRHAGYGVSLRIRKRVEEVFGWMKTVGGLRRTRYRGVARTGLAGYLVATAYNLVRMANLIPESETAPVSSYTRLVARGKPKKVALVAAMHKLLTLLNAVMRDQTPWRIPPQTMPGT